MTTADKGLCTRCGDFPAQFSGGRCWACCPTEEFVQRATCVRFKIVDRRDDEPVTPGYLSTFDGTAEMNYREGWQRFVAIPYQVDPDGSARPIMPEEKEITR